jgi:signal transduction histidine kinase/ligand-binding sensor domain-containing protein
VLLKKKLLHIFFVFIPVLLLSQTKGDNLVLYQLTEQNGLSDNQVTCFFQDSKGFMWIGTQDGLNRFDGSVIRIFKKRSKDSTEIISNYITTITEDKQQNLWIATSLGLSVFDPVKNSFHSLGGKEAINDFSFDKNGNLWIVRWGSITEYIPSQKKFVKYINQTSADAASLRNNNRFNKIIIDNNGRIWLAGYNGLWQFFDSSGEFKKVMTGNNPSGLILSMYKDHEGKIWLGYWNDGLKRFDPDSEKIEDFISDALPYTITGITETKSLQGNFLTWCNGLAEVDPMTKFVTSHLPQTGESPEDFTMAKLFTSHEGLVWIGTDKGTRIMDPAKQFFHHHFISEKIITSQSFAFLQHNDQLYIGGAGDHFLKSYDPTFKLIKKIISQPVYIAGGQLVKPALLNMVRESDHSIWLCTEHGLFLFDERSNQLRLFQLKENDIPVATRNFISNIFIDSRGNHWIFPWRSGIWQLDVPSGQFKKIILGLTKENGDVKKYLVAAATEDAHGNIWFADLDEGLLLYDLNTGQFSKPTEKLFGAQYSLQNVVREGEYIWGVKTGAVFRIHASTKKIDQWPVPDEFNKNVTGFCGDNFNHLWITTNSGLLSFDKMDHSFKRYTANDGLMENVLNGVIFSNKNGKIFYGDKNYITEFDPNELVRSKKTPPVIITNIISQNKSIPLERRGEEKYIDLGSNYNNFTFNWAILNYSNPLQNRFYCKLEGVDKEWKFVGYSGQAQYSSLQPGKYILRVKAATSEGLMNEEGDSLTIIIHPPFWKTWWFILASSIILLTVFIVVVRYIFQRNLKEKLLRLEKEQAVEKERNRISRDMHDDLGSGLTKIAIMSEVVKKQIHEPEKAKVQLENISQSSRELVDNLQDIIWVLNPKNDTLESLAAYIREYGLKFFEPFEISIHFNYPEKFSELKLSEEERRNIFLVIKESFNNIAKHAWCNKVTVCIEYATNEIEIVISDDGKGFEMDHVRKFGNGLMNMQNRMKQVGGSYSIASTVGKGTVTKIEIPV